MDLIQEVNLKVQFMLLPFENTALCPKEEAAGIRACDPTDSNDQNINFRANCIERGPPIWYSGLNTPKLWASVELACPKLHPGEKLGDAESNEQ